MGVMFLCMALTLAACGSDNNAGEAGGLDTSFHSPEGYALYNGGSGGRDRGIECAVTHDDGIVIMGYTRTVDSNDILLLKYRPDGTLDPQFGDGGVVHYEHADGRDDLGFGLAVQPDGKIVVAGRFHDGADFDVLVVRFKTDGTLDSGFGVNGAVVWAGPGGGTDTGRGVAIQPDGKIVVACESFTDPDKDAVLLRFNAAGALDDGFAQGGVFTYAGTGAGDDWGFDVAVQSDGKLVLTGGTVKDGKEDVLLLRLNPDGTLDPLFGVGGVVTHGGAANEEDYGNAVRLQPDGKIIVIGATSNGEHFDILLLRTHPDGTPDPAFGEQGVVIYDRGGYDYAWGGAVQADGRILVAGVSSGEDGGNGMVLRLNPDASPDTSFGSNGFFRFSGPFEDRIYGVVLQSDGRIVGTGYTNDGISDDVLTFRLLN